MITGTDWILIRGATLRALIEDIMSIVGTGAITTLFKAGKRAGKEFASAILREGTPLEELLTQLMAFFTWSGWGKIETRLDFINKRAVVEIYNCATTRRIQSKEPSCHVIRGYIAGIDEVLFNSTTKCSETKCVSKGDPCCFFRVQRKTD